MKILYLFINLFCIINAYSWREFCEISDDKQKSYAECVKPYEKRVELTNKCYEVNDINYIELMEPTLKRHKQICKKRQCMLNFRKTKEYDDLLTKYGALLTEKWDCINKLFGNDSVIIVGSYNSKQLCELTDEKLKMFSDCRNEVWIINQKYTKKCYKEAELSYPNNKLTHQNLKHMCNSAEKAALCLKDVTNSSEYKKLVGESKNITPLKCLKQALGESTDD